jgi:hypothetical protein
MSELLNRKFNTIRQRFREFTYESAAKRSAGVRREVDVRACFAEVFDWVARMSDESDPLVLALDASNLRDRFTVLAISVVYSGTAIPVAWHIQEADAEGEWNRIWDRLLDHLSDVIPAERPVYALTDRGLQSPWLFRRLQRIGWHPVMRIREQGFFHPESTQASFDLATWATKDMAPQQVKGVAFDSEIQATLVGSWDDEADEPLLLLTDCDLDGQQTQLYAYRMWIENGFRDLKRGALNWHDTRIRDPKRAERHWLVLTLALIYLVQRAIEITEDAPKPLTRFDAPGNLGILRYTFVKRLAALLIHLERLLHPVPLRRPVYAPG